MNRHVTVSDIEPAMLSVRSPSGTDVIIDIVMKRQNGEVLDLSLAQPVLQLEPRTGGNGVTYTGTYDVSELGAAAFRIPGGDYKDANGYRLSVWGILDNIYQLLARGTAVVTPATPPSTTGSELPPARGLYNLNIVRSDSWTWQLTLWADTAKTISSDITGAVVAAQVRSTPGGTVLANLGVEVRDAANGLVWLTMTSGTSGALPAQSYWDMQITYPDGDIKTPIQGRVLVSEDITRP